MRRLIVLAFLLTVFSVHSVLSASIEYCKSDGTHWRCEEDEICICRLSDDCKDGDLLVYETDIRTLLCAPRIIDRYVDIAWGNCDYPAGKVKVMAVCDDGGQSEEEEITIYSDSGGNGGNGGNGGGGTATTTTTTTAILCNYVCQATCAEDKNPPFCYRRISHGMEGCPGGTICCESILMNCPTPDPGETVHEDKTCQYECCIDMPGYEYKYCSSGLTCCNHICKESCEPPSRFLIPRSLIFWVILASLIPIIAFLLFLVRKNRDSNIPEY
ncbi:MAG: hypothetical protein ISS48_03390 [Candidatus Aenigmarchaeota archaeon]|nr:hypothetical protein [Candidatus Aenigmarchaeota archaeon]